MEFREIIAVLRKEARLIGFIVGAFIVTTFLWQQSQGPQYQATLLLNVGRAGGQATAEYTYDSFYRLQADERFADTVVRWLANPRMVEDIYREARLDPSSLSAGALQTVFDAGRLSSQVIEVRYGAASEERLRNIAHAVPVVLNRSAENLNRETPETSWFLLLPSDPVIRDARTSLVVAFLAALAVGLFGAFWFVLGKHYFQRTQNNEQRMENAK